MYFETSESRRPVTDGDGHFHFSNKFLVAVTTSTVGLPLHVRPINFCV